MTDDQRNTIYNKLAAGAPRIKACHAARLPRFELDERIEKDLAFRYGVEEMEAAAVGAVEAVLYKGAMRALEDPRYFRFLAFYLERKAGWFKPTTENTGKSVQSVQCPPAPVGAQRAAPSPAATPAENPHKTVQSVQSTGDGAPATNKPANLPTCELATSGKTVQNVQRRLHLQMPHARSLQSKIQNPKPKIRLRP